MEKKFPGVKMTCVEIDKTIIDIAKNYFGMHEILNNTIVHEDAKLSVCRLVKEQKIFDCVIIDLYFGRNIPTFITEQTYLKQIKQLLSPDGCVLINYLREKEYKIKSNSLEHTLKILFPVVHDFEIANNRFFYARLK
jgi:spermidine synthase